MIKFTEAPWVVGSLCRLIDHEYSTVVESIHRNGWYRKVVALIPNDLEVTKEAIARLIAAAPEMYELLSINANVIDTLIHEYELFDDADISWLNDHLDMAEKLLARIDGEEKQK